MRRLMLCTTVLFAMAFVMTGCEGAGKNCMSCCSDKAMKCKGCGAEMKCADMMAKCGGCNKMMKCGDMTMSCACGKSMKCCDAKDAKDGKCACGKPMKCDNKCACGKEMTCTGMCEKCAMAKK